MRNCSVISTADQKCERTRCLCSTTWDEPCGFTCALETNWECLCVRTGGRREVRDTDPVSVRSGPLGSFPLMYNERVLHPEGLLSHYDSFHSHIAAQDVYPLWSLMQTRNMKMRMKPRRQKRCFCCSYYYKSLSSSVQHSVWWWLYWPHADLLKQTLVVVDLMLSTINTGWTKLSTFTK